MTVSRNDKREWWQAYVYPKQTKKQRTTLTKEKIHAINRSNRFTRLALMERLSKWCNRVFNSRLTSKSSYREKWPLDGK